MHENNKLSKDFKAPNVGVAFLLSQVGTYAAYSFEELLAPLGLKPHHAGILRMLGRNSVLTQQALSRTFGIFPSRLVLLLDELEKRGMVERKASANDRRVHQVSLTTTGVETLRTIEKVTRKLDRKLCEGLSTAEQDNLVNLLRRMVSGQNITPAVHPAYRKRLGKIQEHKIK